MSRRAEHNNLSYGLLGTFVSRNNDLDGYWAIGRLKAEAERLGVAAIELELMSKASSPPSPIGSRIAATYRDWLFERIARFTDPRWVASVVIRVDFSPRGHVRFSPHVSWFGEPYVCEVRVTSVGGATRTSRHIGRCATHDPAREHRSARYRPWYARLFGA